MYGSIYSEACSSLSLLVGQSQRRLVSPKVFPLVNLEIYISLRVELQADYGYLSGSSNGRLFSSSIRAC